MDTRTRAWHYSVPAAIALLLLGLLLALTHITAQPSYAEQRSSGAEQYSRGCGSVRGGQLPDARISQAFRVSCRKARRIVRSYTKNGGGVGFVRPKGFPSWYCSSGSRVGSCRRGRKYRARGPYIYFYWVNLPDPSR